MSWKAEYFVLFKLESGKFYISAASSITGQCSLSKYKLAGIENLETLGRSRSTITIKYQTLNTAGTGSITQLTNATIAGCAATRQELVTLQSGKEKRAKDKEAIEAKRVIDEAAAAAAAVMRASEEAVASKRASEEATKRTSEEAALQASPAPKRFSFGDDNTMDTADAFKDGETRTVSCFSPDMFDDEEHNNNSGSALPITGHFTAGLNKSDVTLTHTYSTTDFTVPSEAESLNDMNVSLVLELSDKDAELKNLREEVERLKQAVPAVLVARSGEVEAVVAIREQSLVKPMVRLVKGFDLKLPKENLIDITSFATVNPKLNLSVNKVMEQFYSNRFLSTHSMSGVAPRLSLEQKALLTEPLEVKPRLPGLAAITAFIIPLWQEKHQTKITVKEVREAVKSKINSATRAEVKIQKELKDQREKKAAADLAKASANDGA